jgi:hypothetical protein
MRSALRLTPLAIRYQVPPLLADFFEKLWRRGNTLTIL